MSIVCPSPRLCDALGSSGSLWEHLGSFETLGGFGMLRKALEGMGRLWVVLGCFGFFSGKCFGLGFSLSGRPSALNRTHRTVLGINIWIFEKRVIVECIFKVFAESRLWECCVFSLKIAHM